MAMLTMMPLCKGVGPGVRRARRRWVRAHTCQLGALAVSLALSWPGLAQVNSPVRPNVDHPGVVGYHDHLAVLAILRQQAARSPAVELLEIGRSAAGNAIHVLRLAGPGQLAPDARPAIFVGANLVGDHPSGTEAALALVDTLVNTPEAIGRHTWYVAPVLNPDAHDRFFSGMRVGRRGNGGQLDRDGDGLIGEDRADDLNGDGMITRMRRRDPAGAWIQDPEAALRMLRVDEADPEAVAGATRYAVSVEGVDDDGDGRFNEDGLGGIEPDLNFPHAFDYGTPVAGRWAGQAPEARAVMEFLFARPQVALAIVFGPANHLLAPPEGSGEAIDTGSAEFEIPLYVAEYLGLDAEQTYSLDEIWAVAKDLPIVVRNDLAKADVARYLGVGLATEPADEDLAVLREVAASYKERLRQAGLDPERAAEQSAAGGIAPWLYYQYGAFTIELDLWGPPSVDNSETASAGQGEPPTLEHLAAMSRAEFLALDPEPVQALFDRLGVPAQYSVVRVRGMVEAGQVDPARMVAMLRRFHGGGAAEPAATGDGAGALVTFARAHAPWALVPWTPISLPGSGQVVEVGGIDPLLADNPPRVHLGPSIEVHVQTILAAADRLARLEIAHVEQEHLGGGVHRVRAVVTNAGHWPTHTAQAERARARRPVRVFLELGDGVRQLQGPFQARAERLERSGRLVAQWLVQGPAGAALVVRVHSDQAGEAEQALRLRADDALDSNEEGER